MLQLSRESKAFHNQVSQSQTVPTDVAHHDIRLGEGAQEEICPGAQMGRLIPSSVWHHYSHSSGKGKFLNPHIPGTEPTPKGSCDMRGRGGGQRNHIQRDSGLFKSGFVLTEGEKQLTIPRVLLRLHGFLILKNRSGKSKSLPPQVKERTMFGNRSDELFSKSLCLTFCLLYPTMEGSGMLFRKVASTIRSCGHQDNRPPQRLYVLSAKSFK